MVSKTEFYDVTSRVPREAAKILAFYGTAKSVLTELEPFLDLGITDVIFYNTAGMAGSSTWRAADEADVELQAALADRPVQRPT